MTLAAESRPRAAELLMFRVGGEYFAVALTCAEEALESLPREALPGMPPGMLGVAAWRGRRLPVYGAHRLFGLPSGAEEGVTLVVRALDRPIGLLVDDVEDVIVLDLAALRPVPGPVAADTVLRGVAPHRVGLVAVCDAAGLVRACAGADA